jgi:peptidylprolyl isomerase domain and WD repeat-containing protein 1
LEIFSDNLPNSELYEKSFMHRDVINKILVNGNSEQLISCSVDGHIKFWQKNFRLIDFIKHFKSHRGAITGLSMSSDNSTVCSVSNQDRTLKMYDLKSADLINIIRLKFAPSLCELFY